MSTGGKEEEEGLRRIKGLNEEGKDKTKLLLRMRPSTETHFIFSMSGFETINAVSGNSRCLCCENHMEPLNTLCDQNAEFLMLNSMVSIQ
jgi:hypothetical protein